MAMPRSPPPRPPARRPRAARVADRVRAAVHADHLGLALALLSDNPHARLPPALAEELAGKLRVRGVPASPAVLGPQLGRPEAAALRLLALRRRVAGHRRPAAQLAAAVADLAARGRLNDAFAAVRSAPPAHVTHAALESLIDAAGAVGQLRKAAYVLERLFPTFGLHPSPEAYASFVDACGRAGKVQRAVLALKSHGLIVMDKADQALVYERIVYACVHCGKLDQAETIVRRMKAEGVPRTEQLYANLLRGSARNGPDDRSLGILMLMRLDGFLPNISTYNSLIYGCAREGRLRDAMAFFETVNLSQSMKPNLDTFNALLACCARATKPDTAFTILNKMKAETGIKPNAKSYNWVVVACARAADVERAFEVAETMRSKGIRLNIITNNNLLDACCKAGRLERAFSHVKEMIEVHGITPNSHTYNTLIRGIGRWGNLDAALRMLDSMRTAGISPTVITYSIAVGACARAGGAAALDTAFELVDEMREAGLEPNLVTYNSLIHACARAQRANTAFEVFSQLKRDGIVPDIVTLCSLVDACGRSGETQRAFEVVSSLPSEFVALEPSVPVYNALISTCFKSGDLEMMKVAVQDLKAVGLKPNLRTFSIMISGYGAMGDMSKAVTLLEEMKNIGLTPNQMIYTSLVSGYGHKGDVDSAMNLLEEAKSACGEPDEELYTAAIVAAIGGGRKELALGLSQDMSRAGYHTPTLLNRMMRKVGDTERTAEELRNILTSMEALNIRPQRAAMESLIFAYAKEADVERAFGVLPLMQKLGYPPNMGTYRKVIEACAICGKKEDVDKASTLFEKLRCQLRGAVPRICLHHWVELYEAMIRAVVSLRKVVIQDDWTSALLECMARDCGQEEASKLANRLGLQLAPVDA